MSSVRREDLDLGTAMGQGGQGTVIPVRNRRINQQWDSVYKEYSQAMRPYLNGDALTRMAEEIERLPGDDARWLAEKTAWPAATVTYGSQITGFLMRAIPAPFRFRRIDMTGVGRDQIAELQFLLNADAFITGIGLNVSPRERLLLLADIARTVSRLHSLDIVVGDLSPKNLLFSLGPPPSCFFIDCDAMRLRGQDVLPQAETPGWAVPAGESAGTPASDAYKFALLTVRLLAGDQTTRDPAAIRGIDAGLAGMARKGLAADRSGRPAPSAWIPALEATARRARTSPPPTAPRPQASPSPPRPPGGQPPPPPVPPPAPGGTPAGTKRNQSQNSKVGSAVGGAVLLLVIIIVAVALAHSGNSTTPVNSGTNTGGNTAPAGTSGNSGTTGNSGITGNSDNTGNSGNTGTGSDPWSVVQAYYSDINSADYSDAWGLFSSSMQQQMGSESGWQQGYNTTASVQVTENSESGDKVYVGISADQTDGSTKTYSGSYTVDNGEITGASISGG